MCDTLNIQIIKEIGSGQFSKVYQAKWLNAPMVQGTLEAYHKSGANIIDPVKMQSNHYLATNSGTQQVNQTGGGDLIDLNRQIPAMPTTEKLVALKIIRFYDIQNSKDRVDILKEVNLLQQVRHPNIINFYTSFMYQNELCIVLEFAGGGDLSKLIRYFQKKKSLIPEQTILKYFTQVCSAVKYIHSKRILHRDIKPANILTTSDGCVKLGDFGLGRFFSQNTRDAHSLVGTFYYMSPERITNSGYSFSSDVWSLGCVLYELITLESPFSIMNYELNNALIMNNQTNHSKKRPFTTHQQSILPNNQTPHHHHHNHHQNCNQPQQQQQQGNPYNLQWLMDRIVRAEYPSLDTFENINPALRYLTYNCLNPNSELRPNMQYVCEVVNSVYDNYLRQHNQ